MDGAKKFFGRWARGARVLLIIAAFLALPLVLLAIVGSVLSIVLSVFNWEMILLAAGVGLALLGVPYLLGSLVEDDEENTKVNNSPEKTQAKKAGSKPKTKKNKRA